MKHLAAFLLLVACAVMALAGQVCTPDPPRPVPLAASAVQGYYVAKPSPQRALVSADSAYRLFNPQGDQFTPIGVNHNHWDMAWAYTDIQRTGANTVRIVVPLPTSQGPAYVQHMLDQFVAQGLLVIPSYWDATCKAEVAPFRAIVDRWVSMRPTYAKYDATMLLNIANEWGPSDGSTAYVGGKNVYTPNYTWRDENSAAVLKLRAAGYPNTIVIDAGGCGQNATLVARDGAAVLAADPLRNVLFDVHVYGGFHRPATASWMQDYDKAMAALAASGLPIMLGEFGPGRNIGPSPTTVPPEDVIAVAQGNGWGWLAWAYGDNNLQKCQADDSGFSMTRNCGAYVTDDDLTAFGRTVVPLLKAGTARATLH